ncbi:MAG: Stringent starvation protein [Myxococcaceae bacterium]|nr:Stringent starvation protein [Myxococcaceae bacterium]
MPVEPPPKKDQLQKLLERGNVFLHLDPRVEGVVVPAWHAQKPQLVLQLGLHFAVPIPDLKIDDRGVRCTLSFSRSPFFCDLPWTAIYAMVAEDGQVTVWPTELPPELVPQPSPVRRAPPTSRTGRGRADTAESTSATSDAEVPAERPRPRIAAVPSGKTQKLAPVTPIKPAPAPAPAEVDDHEPSPDDPAPTPGDRKGSRERPAWLRVVK